MAFLPNRDKFYNTETKRLHAGTFNTWGQLDAPGSELGDYTFNLVTKIDPWWKFWLLPGGTQFYPAEVFPTSDTTSRILAIVRAQFPAFTWESTGNTVDPKDIKEQVNITATNKAGKTATFSPGVLAINHMINGFNYAFNISFATELKNAFED